jgi:hypothetical protein
LTQRLRMKIPLSDASDCTAGTAVYNSTNLSWQACAGAFRADCYYKHF